MSALDTAGEKVVNTLSPLGFGSAISAVLGALALGTFLGFTTLVFLAKSPASEFTWVGLGALISAILGLAVFTAISKAGGTQSAVSFYLIGLFLGLVLFLVVGKDLPNIRTEPPTPTVSAPPSTAPTRATSS